MSDLVGTVIRGYEIKEKIGQGGFGSVYRAYQASVEREVAMKAILPEYANNPNFIRQFDSEARVVARLEHPFIVPLFDYWREPNAAYLVMRYFPSGSLAGRLKNGKPSLKQVAQMLDQLAGALDTAHEHDMIHLDIKPDNILLDSQNNAYLTDFGLARSLNEQESASKVSGTLAYMSPEMLKGELLFPQSDIYSLGLVIAELVAGYHPYFGSHDTKPSFDTIIKAHLNGILPHAEGVPDQVYEVIKHATALEPFKRYATTRQFAQEFRNALFNLGVISPYVTQEIDISQPVANPYKGLQAFQEADALDFYGRSAVISQLVQHLVHESFLAVVGPSGSGKSSVVHAGLVPKLRYGGIEGSEDWFVAKMMPDRQPLRQLESALRGVAVTASDHLYQDLQTTPLTTLLSQLLPPNSTLVLVIDQFEEVFTQLEDEAQRLQFLKLVADATQTFNPQLRVIITLRADFYDRPLLYETFGKLMQANTHVILPLDTHDLTEAIVKPSERVGMQIEPALVTQMIADVSEEVGALPLLQYALTELFERREGRRLTLQAYQESGGVLGALARRADEVYRQLPTESQALTQQIFLRLVTLGEGTEDTRRRVQRSELTSLSKNVAPLQLVLDKFGQYRLLSFDRDGETREPTIEVAHEALIRQWKLLRHWLDTSREDIRLQRLLAQATADWQTARQDESYLLRGTRLAQYEDWARTASITLSQNERAFLTASVERRKKEELLATEQEAQEKRLQRMSRNRLVAIIGLLTILVVAGAFVLFNINRQRDEIQRARDNAESARQTAEFNAQEAVNSRGTSDANSLIAQQNAEDARNARATSDANSLIAQQSAEEAQSFALAINAQQAFSEGDAQLAVSLALKAVEGDNIPSEAYDTLVKVAYAPGLRLTFNEQELVGDEATAEAEPTTEPKAVTAVAVSPDIAYVVLGYGNVVFTRPGDTATQGGGQGQLPSGQGQLPSGQGQLPSGQGQLPSGQGQANVGFYPEFFFQPPSDETPFLDNPLVLIDAHTGQVVRRLEGLRTSIMDVAFVLRDEQLFVVAVTTSGQVGVWNANTGEFVLNKSVNSSKYQALSVSADGQYLLVTTSGTPRDNGVLTYIDLNNGTIQWSRPEQRAGLIRAKLFRDGEYGMSLYWGGRIAIWEVATGQEVAYTELDFEEQIAESVDAIPMSDQQVLINGFNQAFIFWNWRTNTLTTQDPEVERPHKISLSDDERLISFVTQSGQINVWSIRGERRINTINQSALAWIVTIGSTSNGDTLAIGRDDGLVELWDVNSVPANELVESSILDTAVKGAYLPNQTNNAIIYGYNIASDNSRVPQIIVWDMVNDTVLKEILTDSAIPIGLAVSPDGRFVVTGSDNTVPEIANQISVPSQFNLWNIETGELLWSVDLPNGQRGQAVTFDPNSGINGEPLRIATNWERGLRIWNLETGDAILTLSQYPTLHHLAYIADGTRLVGINEERRGFIWDVATGDELFSFSVPPKAPIAVNPVNDSFATLNTRNAIIVIDSQTGDILTEFGVNSEQSWQHLAFSPDGQFLIGGVANGKLSIWDVETQAEIRSYPSNDFVLRDLAMSVDGETFLVTYTNAVGLWRTNPIDLAEVLAWTKNNRFIRALTAEECVKYRVSVCDTPSTSDVE